MISLVPISNIFIRPLNTEYSYSVIRLLYKSLLCYADESASDQRSDINLLSMSGPTIDVFNGSDS